MANQVSNPIQRTAVEQIVRQVLAELRSGAARSNVSPPLQTIAKTGILPRPSLPEAAAQLTLTSKVVSVKLIEGRLAGITQLVVPRGAVFTPAARDELKKFRVSIASAVEPGKPQGGVKVHVAVAGSAYSAGPLLAALLSEGIRFESVAGADLPGVVDTLGHLAGNGRVLLITDQSAAALCLANRKSGVRAALASSIAAITAALVSIGPNFLVLEPRGRSIFEMKQTLRPWLRGGDPKCPAALQPYIG